MDALPITEATGATFASTHPGCMHACGHDGHMAMALAAAQWVDAVRSGLVAEVSAADMRRNVLFVFQPAEETTGGARRICETGVFEHLNATRIFGFHLWPDLPHYTYIYCALLARSSETTVVFHGRSSHIAKWRDGRDALGAGGAICGGLQVAFAPV